MYCDNSAFSSAPLKAQVDTRGTRTTVTPFLQTVTQVMTTCHYKSSDSQMLNNKHKDPGGYSIEDLMKQTDMAD